jgi:hypothetical protein
MKKMLIVITILLSGAFVMPALAGITGKKGHPDFNSKKKKITFHEQKMKDLDWVNYQTEQQFESDFPQATNVKWRQGNFAEATFTESAIIKTAYYDRDNNLVGTTTKVSYSALPVKAQKDIQKNFPDYKVADVILFTDNPDNDTDMYLFSAPFDDEDNYFAEVDNGAKKAILKVTMDGEVSFFQNF